MEFVITVFVGAILVAAAVFTSYLTRGKKSVFPPGPKGFSAFKDFLQSIINHTTFRLFGRWARDFGEIFYLSLPGQKIVVLNSAEAIRHVYNGPSKNVSNGRPPSFLGQYFFQGFGITFNAPSKLWKQLRQIFHSSINMHVNGGAKIDNILRRELEKVSAELEKSEKCGEVKITELSSNYLLTVLHILITGDAPEPDSPNIELMAELDDLMNKTLALDQEVVLSTFPFLRHLPNSYGRRWRRMLQLKEKITDIFYVRYFENFKNSEQGVINSYIKKMKEEGTLVTEGHVRVVVMELIAAGYVTSFSTLKAILLFCLHKPEIQARLHQEIVDVIGDNPPSLKDRHQMPFFESFFLETMRYTSQLPTGFPHIASESFQYKDYVIPKDAMILPNLFHANHDEKFWDDPWSFKPDRFLHDGQMVDPLSDLRRSFVSFGIGKRMCPGESFAKSRIFMFIATLFQKYELVPTGSGPLPSHNPYDWQPGLILMPGRFNCKLVPRKRVQSD